MLKAFSSLADTAFRDNISYLAFKADKLVVISIDFIGGFNSLISGCNYALMYVLYYFVL
jgi:hypothetical protein